MRADQRLMVNRPNSAVPVASITTKQGSSSSTVECCGKRRGEGTISPSEFGVISSWRRVDANRRTFPSRCYGPTHSSTECVVHLEVTAALRLDFVVAHWYAPRRLKYTTPGPLCVCAQGHTRAQNFSERENSAPVPQRSAPAGSAPPPHFLARQSCHPNCHPIIRNWVATPGTGRDERMRKLNQINPAQHHSTLEGTGAALYKTAALPLS